MCCKERGMIAMRRIWIDAHIKEVAKDYKKEFDKYKEDRKKALERLKQKFFDGNVEKEDGTKVASDEIAKYKDYLTELIFDYENDRLVLMTPGKFEDTHDEYKKKQGDDALKVRIRFGSKKTTKPFWEWICDAMGYQNFVRDKIYPAISNSLSIKACVYCNANFTITDKKGNGYYDLDHWKPKSVYPFLCASFYNLQPCCPHCNKRKSDDTVGEYMGLYEEDEKKKGQLDVFQFEIPRGSLVRYFAAQDTSHLTIDFKPANPSCKNLRDTAETKFGIKGIYNEHIDVVEEMMWRAKFYNNTILRSMIWFFDKRWKVVDIARFKLGTYANIDEIHKRPLTKFMQDIGRELEII